MNKGVQVIAHVPSRQVSSTAVASSHAGASDGPDYPLWALQELYAASPLLQEATQATLQYESTVAVFSGQDGQARQCTQYPAPAASMHPHSHQSSTCQQHAAAPVCPMPYATALELLYAWPCCVSCSAAQTCYSTCPCDAAAAAEAHGLKEDSIEQQAQTMTLLLKPVAVGANSADVLHVRALLSGAGVVVHHERLVLHLNNPVTR